MLAEYQEQFYSVAASESERLRKDGFAESKALVVMRQLIDRTWSGIHVGEPQADKDVSSLHVGDEFTVTTHVGLGGLKPEDVQVEVYHGPVGSNNTITQSHSAVMDKIAEHGIDEHVYSQIVKCKSPGRYGFTVRARPKGREWNSVIPGYMTWAR